MEKKAFSTKLGTLSISIIRVISIILLILLFTINLVYTAKVSYDYNEKVSYNITFWYLIPLIILVVMFVYVSGLLKNASALNLYIMFSVIYIAAALFIIFSFSNHIRADAANCWSISSQFIGGDFSALQKGGYINFYPFQLGLVTYDMIVRLFSGNERLLYIICLIEVLIINWFGYLISDKLFGNKLISNITLTLEFLFLPQFFLIQYGYGTIPGMCCIMISFYHFVCLSYKEKAPYHGALAILFAVFAAILKQNFCIAAIAMGIILVVNFLQEKKNAYYLLIAVLIVFLPLSANTAVKNIYSTITGIDIGDGVPIISWIAMGTDLDNEMRAPGWYDGSSWFDYVDCNYDTKATSEMARAKFRENISDSLKNPSRTVKFYGKKIISMWTDPMFQSVYRGPLINEGQCTETSSRVLVSLYTGGRVEQIIAVIMKGLLILIIATTLLYQLCHGKEKTGVLLFPLYMIGGFIFHFFSEAKSEYMYMYIFVLLPICAYELVQIRAFLRDRHQKAR